MADKKIILEPQKGYQEMMLSSPADIVIGGAAAGVGKTYSLLFDFPRYRTTPGWGGVIFRRTSPQIRNEGGLWDTSNSIYPLLGFAPRESFLEWVYAPTNVKMKFSHLEHEKNILDWQGAQIPFIGFDELTHFTEKMFFYLLSRNRSTCGIKPYVRATCNPDPDSWVAKLIEWWIDQETGYPIPERNGVIRYFIKNGDTYIWGDSKEEVIEKAWYFLEELVKQGGIDPREFVKSITFISGSIYQNKKLLDINPAYLANLLSQDEDTQAQLLHGNWKVRISDQDIYNYYAFLGMFDNVYEVSKEGNYITTDIALKGSNKFTVGHWTGNLLDDLLIMDKSKGNEVIEGIKTMANRYKTPNHNITFDNDGVGGFVDGFIVGAKEFVNNSAALPDPKNETRDAKGNVKPANYPNLKTQCYYKSGDACNRGEYKIAEHVASMMYDDKTTVRQRFMQERKAIKRAKTNADGKLCIIKKEEMIAKLNGDSPDLMDMFMMREVFNLTPKKVFKTV